MKQLLKLLVCLCAVVLVVSCKETEEQRIAGISNIGRTRKSFSQRTMPLRYMERIRLTFRGNRRNIRFWFMLIPPYAIRGGHATAVCNTGRRVVYY